MMFKNRQQAGMQLANALKKYKGKNTVVYALPRGGVVLGAAVAEALEAPLDLIIPRKIGHPYNPEYAIAAVTEGGDMVSEPTGISHIDSRWLKSAVGKELAEAARRRELYLRDRKPIEANGKICIVVDDGLATGLTMKAALAELRRQKPGKIIIAVPVAPHQIIKEISPLADEMVVLYAPAGFFPSVGAFYHDFEQVSDEEVISFLNAALV